jgi:hypothetical protein
MTDREERAKPRWDRRDAAPREENHPMRRGVGPEVVRAPTRHDMPKKGGKGKKKKR